MSSDVVIRVSNLGKKYRIRHQTPERYTALRDVIARAAGAPFRRLGASVKSYLLSENGYRPPNNHSLLTDNQSSSGASPASASASQALRTSTSDVRSSSEDFWALRGVSFEVKRGEVLGIIGRNGAGKSTLLKILSRITEPTKGQIEIEGRVGSLLEVGTGFHPELTGRENIYLNGAILGMSRAEIQREFDEIVAFAEVERFLDTPVKRYSSGMYVRLAFAVAAHLESEILIVDEVLAVGDAAFQQKCLGKMQDVGRRGRTVLLVSHSTPILQRLCSEALLFARGTLRAHGEAAKVIRSYLQDGCTRTSERVWSREKSPGDQVAILQAVRILDHEGRVSENVQIDQECFIEIEYFHQSDISLKPATAFHLVNEAGTVVFASSDFTNIQWWKAPRKRGRVRTRCCIPANFLAEGSFTVLAAVCSYNPNIVHACEPDAIAFQVVDRAEGLTSRGPYSGSNWPGVIRPMLNWDVHCD